MKAIKLLLKHHHYGIGGPGNYVAIVPDNIGVFELKSAFNDARRYKHFGIQNGVMNTLKEIEKIHPNWKFYECKESINDIV